MRVSCDLTVGLCCVGKWKYVACSLVVVIGALFIGANVLYGRLVSVVRLLSFSLTFTLVRDRIDFGVLDTCIKVDRTVRSAGHMDVLGLALTVGFHVVNDAWMWGFHDSIHGNRKLFFDFEVSHLPSGVVESDWLSIVVEDELLCS